MLKYTKKEDWSLTVTNSVSVFKRIFINTSDSFAIPICGERITWVCINLCL